jgi:hypothetical protein
VDSCATVNCHHFIIIVWNLKLFYYSEFIIERRKKQLFYFFGVCCGVWEIINVLFERWLLSITGD